MSVTVLYENVPARIPRDVREDGDHVWLSAEDFEAATEWTLKPEGLCRDEACVRLPSNGSWRDADGRIDLVGFAERFGRPIIRDEEHSVWAFGASVNKRLDRLLDAEAPDFTLPDLEGRMHSLSDYRGKKVFLFSWGSY